MAHAMLRPVKRDVVVCLVTFLFAWLTLGIKHGSNDDKIYGDSYSMPAEVDSSKASWYGSHYIAKVSNKFSNFKGLWPGSAKELEQLEDVLCPTMPDGSYGHYNHKGYSDSVRRVSDETTTPQSRANQFNSYLSRRTTMKRTTTMKVSQEVPVVY